jgi:hypothetical protein
MIDADLSTRKFAPVILNKKNDDIPLVRIHEESKNPNNTQYRGKPSNCKIYIKSLLCLLLVKYLMFRDIVTKKSLFMIECLKSELNSSKHGAIKTTRGTNN